MNMKRILVAAFAAAIGCSVMGTGAFARECKSETVTAEGEIARLRDLGAYPNSLFAWRKAVKDKFGGEWNSWRYAQDAKVDCQQITSGGQSGWKCVRTAKPCQDTLSTVAGGAAEALKPKDCKAETLSSYGSREKSQDEATKQAQFGWEIDTKKKYGAEFAKWSEASGGDIDCRKVSGDKTQCIAVATPCKPK